VKAYFCLKRVLIFLLLCSFSAVSWAWQGTLDYSKTIPDMGTYYKYRFDERKHFPVYVRIAVLDAVKYDASLFVQDKDAVQSLMHLSLEEKATIAINGGYYRENFLPNGLLIVEGKRKSRFVSNTLLAAVVMITKDGKIKLIKKGASYKDAKYAFQAGPILLEGEKQYAGTSTLLRQRSVVIEFENGQLALVSLSPATMNEAASILEILVKELKKTVKLAVNLDGGVASSFIINFNHHPIIVPERADVKMSLLFYPQK
jgi:uncharacterized protein YigE (DUF2233 family)